MPKYKLKVSVEKQNSPTTCWAAVMPAVLRDGSNQESLVKTYSRLAAQSGQMDVRKIFDQLNRKYDECNLKTIHTSSAGLEENVTKCAKLITTALGAGNPVICGLTTYDRKELPLSTPQGGRTTVAWRHMVLLYDYDEVNRLCFYKDPARDSSDQKVYLRALLAGFLYMKVKDLGEKTLEKLDAKKGMLDRNQGIVARAFKLIIPS